MIDREFTILGGTAKLTMTIDAKGYRTVLIFTKGTNEVEIFNIYNWGKSQLTIDSTDDELVEYIENKMSTWIFESDEDLERLYD